MGCGPSSREKLSRQGLTVSRRMEFVSDAGGLHLWEVLGVVIQIG